MHRRFGRTAGATAQPGPIRQYAYQRARLFPGGSLKVVAGKAPRNFRRHTARILLVDEVDAIEASAEGDSVDSGLP